MERFLVRCRARLPTEENAYLCSTKVAESEYFFRCIAVVIHVVSWRELEFVRVISKAGTCASARTTPPSMNCQRSSQRLRVSEAGVSIASLKTCQGMIDFFIAQTSFILTISKGNANAIAGGGKRTGCLS